MSKIFNLISILKYNWLNLHFVYLKIFTLFFFVIIFSCSKKESELTAFKIINPSKKSVFNNKDTIFFKIQNLNNVDFTYLQLSIVDNKNNVVARQEQYFPKFSNSLYVNYFLINMHTHISGNFFLKFQLFNKNNIATSEFIEITVNAIPKETLGYYVITEKNNNQLEVFRLDLSANIINSFILNSDYLSSDINSQTQSLLICGEFTGNLNSFSTETHNLQWSVPTILNPPFPYFYSMNFDDKFVSVGLYNGTINGYNHLGSRVFSFHNANFRSFSFMRHFNSIHQIEHFVFLSSDIQNLFHRINITFSASYSFMQFVEFNWKPFKIFSLNDNNLIVFGNQNNQAIMKMYSLNHNILNDLIHLPNYKLVDVVEISKGVFAISIENQILMYNHNINQLSQLYQYDGYNYLSYNNLANTLIVSNNKTLKLLDINSNTVLNQTIFQNRILKTHVLFSR